MPNLSEIDAQFRKGAISIIEGRRIVQKQLGGGGGGGVKNDSAMKFFEMGVKMGCEKDLRK